MAEIPFLMNLDSPPFYGHDMFPNRMFRRQHAREPPLGHLDLHTLGLIAKMGAQAHHLVERKQSGELATLGTAQEKSNGYEINLDVSQFEPEELSVKLVNGFIVVEGKHDEREDDHGHVQRHILRRYLVPKKYDLEAISSTLSLDGVITVRVPLLIEKDKVEEREIPIKLVGPSDLFIKNGVKESKEPEKQDV